MLSRILEPEVMDTEDEARDYDQMDHSTVNRVFVTDLLAAFPQISNPVLDVGTGTAQIPIVLCQSIPAIKVVAIDMAKTMLDFALQNVCRAELQHQIELQHANARALPYSNQSFACVISNSIIHHIPEPIDCFREMMRVCQANGVLFIRDLVRPDSVVILDRLVQTYTADANDHQRQLFAQSLHAALTVAEVREMVQHFGFSGDCVQQTSDRHWTFAAIHTGRYEPAR